ncbi:MAG: hypothetical protein GWN86_06275 [Desulfobacterales bacterium]|nr:hypothetical protein [Desulfobacterales bacterium]
MKLAEPKKKAPLPAVKAAATLGPPPEFPSEFTVDVDGEVFNVKISPVIDGAGKDDGTTEAGGPEEVPPGAVLCGMPGLILSIEAKLGAHVNEGDLVAIIEAMKMRRHVNAPHSGEVKEIRVSEGEMVDPEDILMVVE